jgi:hypothetical protein
MDKKEHTKSTNVLAAEKNLSDPNPAWPKVIVDFKGIGDTIPSFESYRDELKDSEVENWRG